MRLYAIRGFMRGVSVYRTFHTDPEDWQETLDGTCLTSDLLVAVRVLKLIKSWDDSIELVIFDLQEVK